MNLTFTFKPDDAQAPLILRTWGRGRLYEIDRRAALDATWPADLALRPRANEAIAVADAMEAWKRDNPGKVFVRHRRCTPDILASIQQWVEKNPTDAHARLVAILLADMKEA